MSVTREPAPSIERIGSARRAWVSVRNTTAVFAPLWFSSLFFHPVVQQEGWDDLQWVIAGMIFYSVALVVILPIFAFTLGRWIDKRTWRSTRRAVLTFGYYGLAWGVIAVGLYGIDGRVGFGLLLWLLIPGVAAAAARLLLDVRNPVWTAVSWALYVLALLPALWVILIQFTSGFGQSV